MNAKMYKTRKLFFVCMGVLLSGFLMGGPVQARTLSYSVYSSPASPGGQTLAKTFKMIEKETDGKLKFDLYAGGTLTNGKTTLSGISNGIVDGGGIIAAYTPSALPVNTILTDLWFYNDDIRVSAAASVDTLLNDCPACLAEFKKHNVHPLNSLATSPFYIMCKDTFDKGFNPEGLRMRAGVSETARWIKEIGGIPVGMAQTEAYQALQRNTVDCALGSLAWLHAYSWDEVVNSVVNIPVGGYQGGSLLNFSQAVWDSFDEKTKDILRKSGMHSTAELTYIYVREDKTASEEARKKYHVKFIDASPGLEKEVKKFKETEVEVAIDKARSRGVKNPEAVTSAFIKNIKKWKKIIGNKDLSESEYEQLLVDHVLKEGKR